MSGTLYVVATPLGNLDDLSPRAARVLCEVDVVACEDTRRTGRLLQHIGSRVPTVSYFAHNEARRSEQIVARLQSGQDVALVSDAGTPGISDPGERLVAACVGAEITLVPIPGPAAVAAVLSVAGVPTGRFVFEGFAPREKGARQRLLAGYEHDTAALVLYESPRRIVALLDDVVEVLGATREVCVAREVTKLHEEFVRGPVGEVLEVLRGRDVIKGEITLVVGGGLAKTEATSEEDARVDLLIDALKRQGLRDRSIRDVIVEVFERPKREVYARILGREQDE